MDETIREAADGIGISASNVEFAWRRLGLVNSAYFRRSVQILV